MRAHEWEFMHLDKLSVSVSESCIGTWREVIRFTNNLSAGQLNSKDPNRGLTIASLWPKNNSTEYWTQTQFHQFVSRGTSMRQILHKILFDLIDLRWVVHHEEKIKIQFGRGKDYYFASIQKEFFPLHKCALRISMSRVLLSLVYYRSARAIRAHFLSGLRRQASRRFKWSPGHHSRVNTIPLTKLSFPWARFRSGSFTWWVLTHDFFTWILSPFPSRRCNDGVQVFLIRIIIYGPWISLVVGGLMDHRLKCATHLRPYGHFGRRISKAIMPMHCKASILPCKLSNFTVRPEKLQTMLTRKMVEKVV